MDENWTIKKAEGRLMLSNCGAREDSWESLGQQEDQTSQSQRKSTLNIHWKDWCWSWSANILHTWCKELTHWKRPWCWERLRARGEEGERRWDGGLGVWNKLGYWNWHKYTTIYKIDNEKWPSVKHSKLYSILCNGLYGKRIFKRSRYM